MRRVNWFMLILANLVFVGWSTGMAQEKSSEFKYIPPECGPATFIIDDDEGYIEMADKQNYQLQATPVELLYGYKMTKVTDAGILTVSIDCVSQNAKPFNPGLSVGLCGETCSDYTRGVCRGYCAEAATLCVATTGNLVACDQLFDQCVALCDNITASCVGECSGYGSFRGFETSPE